MLSPGVQVEIEERGQKRVFNTAAEARDFVLGRPLGLVLKADGLAAGKGVYVCDNLRQALEAHRPDHGPAHLRPGRRPPDHRGAARRPGGQRPGPHRRPHDHPARIEPGLQARLRPRRRAQYRRHGGILADQRAHPRADGAGRARDPGPGDPRLEASPPAVPRRALRRADAHQPGPEGPRIQRPVRRPRDPGRARCG